MRERLQHLINNYLTGKATPEDEEKLSGWLDELSTSPMPGHALSDKEKEQLRKRLLQNIRRNTGQSSPRKILWMRTGIAAAILSVLFAGYLLLRFYTTSTPPAYVAVHTAVGEKKIITLPDSTRIWLAPNTTLEYPATYPEQRDIQLVSGEAFFDVTPDANHHFTVLSDSILVKVLGTSFNIKAYPQQRNTQITVSSGRISISRNEVQMGQLTAGEQININKADYHTERITVTIPSKGAWMHERILFDNIPLQEALPMLENYYNVHFILQQQEPLLISGVLNTSLTIEQVIAALEELTSHTITFKKQSNNSYTVQ
ncbi:FecR family protein [Chitinophaga rhizophila]|uniref:FecR domain-containing protein n=1 Tax=Chitinophaga rhizophila TaxID=2866212 RepID=A0ABS7GGR3_9BACT|nr:FecR family protein [Chitinophaga rhizophila]MBW8686315.1 FecR domain-containing protein [Chitinophaga rhizophila]